MRFTSSLKNFSFGLAIISFVGVGAASAQSLVGVNTRLDHTLDSKTAAAGQVVTVKLDGPVKTADGIDLPRGTELVGKVAAVKNDGGASSVSLVFTTAKLKSGKEVPVKATVLAAYPPSAGEGATYSIDTIGEAPAQVTSDRTFAQQPGSLRHVAMTSAVKDNVSGTFSSTNGSFRLTTGTYLQVGVGAAANGGATSAAE